MSRLPAAAAATRLRLCFLGYRRIRQFAMPVLAEFAHRADIEMVDGSFDDALGIARDRVARGLVDAFVTAGSNASVLRHGVQAPVAVIQLTGFDLLQALIQARRLTSRVGIVMYGQTIPELEAVKGLLNIEITQYAYQTPDDARQRFEQLRGDGFTVIVGSSLVVELAEECGLTGLLAYSLDAIRRALEDAIELARVARLEASRYEQLNGVLHNLQDAVLAVDEGHRIIALNPPMLAVLGRPVQALMGHALDAVEPELSLADTLAHGRDERGLVQRFAQRDWVVHRTPIRAHGEIVGAALTLYDAQHIETAETNLRVQQRRRQRTARHSFDSLIGHSPAFVQAVHRAQRYARNDLTVLLSGESGTGKELFAQAMHNASARAARPFIAVNCASFPESLLESELFGYEDGAFTGARRGGKRGLVEAAHTGTLFLDEIGDMPLALQSRLLRVLQEREVMRLGAASAIPVDLRVIAATHQPLAERVREQRFRQDLYYRLNALQLALPALRERREDIVPLAQVMLRDSLARLGLQRDTAPFLARLRGTLEAYDWPGNVRELHNLCERWAVCWADSAHAQAPDDEAVRAESPELFEAVPVRPMASAASALAPPDVLTPASVREALRQSSGNRQQAAQRLGVSRSTLWRWLRAHDEG
jgi:propionate catabolism operon transcriptional regulator